MSSALPAYLFTASISVASASRGTYLASVLELLGPTWTRTSGAVFTKSVPVLGADLAACEEEVLAAMQLAIAPPAPPPPEPTLEDPEPVSVAPTPLSGYVRVSFNSAVVVVQA